MLAAYVTFYFEQRRVLMETRIVKIHLECVALSLADGSKTDIQYERQEPGVVENSFSLIFTRSREVPRAWAPRAQPGSHFINVRSILLRFSSIE